MPQPNFNSLKTCLCGLGLLVLVSGTGCQSDYAGQTLPSPYWLTDDVQYFAPGPEFKLTNEAIALKTTGAAQQNRAPLGPVGPLNPIDGGPAPGPAEPLGRGALPGGAGVGAGGAVGAPEVPAVPAEGMPPREAPPAADGGDPFAP